MEQNRNLTTLEILSIAIKSEIDAVKLYTKMRSMVESEDLKEKFGFLIAQEIKHEKLLKDAYKKKFPEVELALPPASIVPMIDDVLSRDASLKELFEAGMKAEKMAEEFYRDLAKRTGEISAKNVLMYMSNMEKSHYAILEAEWQQIEIAKSEDASKFLEGDGLMMLGP
jgi:rubrerythrin